jgi:protein gp37
MNSISWTNETWNPIVGCTIDTKGCTNCYAMRQAWRFSHNPSTPQYHGTAKLVNGKPVWTGKINLAEKALEKPLRRKKPTMYFVNSMGDLFHEDVPDQWIDQVFAVMALCPQHTFQILTKRAERMREYCVALDSEYLKTEHIASTAAHLWGGKEPDTVYDCVYDKFTSALPNVWMGVSVEDQATADQRIPLLLNTPAAIRFVSAEPLLEKINMLVTDKNGHDIGALLGLSVNSTDPDGADVFYRTEKLDWVICGGESGPNARPMHPSWARFMRDQCVDADVPFHFKQWGPKHDGRLLDGRVWDQMPEVKS